MNAANVTYDSAEDILFVDAAGVRADSRADIDAFFDGIIAAWRALCSGKRVDVIVSYDGFQSNLLQNDYYGKRELAAANLLSKAVVRYGGDSLTRTAARVRSLKLRVPSRLYQTREQALEAVRALRAERPAPSR